MKRNILFLLLSIFAFANLAQANDGVYFTSGAFLVPVQETTISVSKEVLTITIGEDSMALVDVYYEFMNPEEEKTVTMAFEADAPYNAYGFRKDGIHPYIQDFTIVMNGKSLTHTNALVAKFWGVEESEQDTDFQPLDLIKWKEYEEATNALYNAESDSVIGFAYAYYFKATFKPGKNIVHHTYKYNMSFGVGYAFQIPYWLTPATRWANKQVDDFTLKIKNQKGEDFCMTDTLFVGAPFTFENEQGGVKYQFNDEYGVPTIMASMSEGNTLIWHTTDFRPTGNMQITSVERINHRGPAYFGETSRKVVISSDGDKYRYIGETDDSYFVDAQDYGFKLKKDSHIEEYDAEKGQGIIIIRNDEGKSVNVRKSPTTKSPIIASIRDVEGEMPEVYPCLGLQTVHNGIFYEQWFKTRINNKVGYIRADLMMWDCICTY